MSRKLISGFHDMGQTLPTADLQVGQPALREIGATLAGHAMAHHAWATGDTGLPDGTLTTMPMAPGGTGYGHDHSGGTAGRPLFRSIFISQTGPYSLLDTSVNAHPGRRLESTGMDTGVTYGDASAPMFVDVPGCDPGEWGAYSHLGVQVAVWIHGDTSAYTTWHASDVVRVGLHNETTGGRVYWDLVLTNNDHGTQRFLRSENADSTLDRLPMRPGEVNIVRVYSSITLHASSTASTAKLWVPEVEMGVYTDTPDS